MARENPAWILWGLMAPHDALLMRELMLRGGCRAHEGGREGCGYRDLSAVRCGEKPQEGCGRLWGCSSSPSHGAGPVASPASGWLHQSCHQQPLFTLIL